MKAITSYDDAMAAIHSRSAWDRGFISDPSTGADSARRGLVRTGRMLERLGRPQDDLAIVHVAGSKGKGSTCAFIDGIVRATGVRCGRFLSPHLHSFRERFTIDGNDIDEGDFAVVAADVLAAATAVETADATTGPVTAFELATSLALTWFSRQHCALAVVEVGLGGTLDATNVVEPVVSVITTLDYEHTGILGATMREIAANKAGIIKPGVPVITALMPGEALSVVRDRARDQGAPWRRAGREWTVAGTARTFTVHGKDWRHERLMSPLAGRHQVANAGLAIAAVHELVDLGLLPREDLDRHVRDGLASTALPGRFEVIQHGSGLTFALDGAHTRSSMAALAETVREVFPSQAVSVIVGMMADKDLGELLGPLLSLNGGWIVTAPASPRARSGRELQSWLQTRQVAAGFAPSVAEAIAGVIARAGQPQDPVVVVTGSLAMVAEARIALGRA